MAVQNPFFGKREPETFQPRHTTVTPSSSVNSVAPTSASTSAATATAAAAKAPAENSGSKLTVGPNIKLKGVEITDCDTLVVEGTVEATMDSRVIQIAEQGAFRGSADIDIAEIRGEFNGTLTVRDKLVIFGTGRVSGGAGLSRTVSSHGACPEEACQLGHRPGRRVFRNAPAPGAAGHRRRWPHRSGALRSLSGICPGPRTARHTPRLPP